MKRDINKTKKIEIDGSELEIGIVVAKFNSDITEKMLQGALETLKLNKVKRTNIKVVWIPGSFEIPLACQKLAQTKKYDALIALGCVIKGETDHYRYIAGEASRGVMDVMLKYNIPIGFGVLTVDNLKQAKARAAGKNNKGSEAVEATLKMIGNFE